MVLPPWPRLLPDSADRDCCRRHCCQDESTRRRIDRRATAINAPTFGAVGTATSRTGLLFNLPCAISISLTR